ncbi:MAG TPA: hypothetical protein VM580_00635, partial [Labilithrix sp.]|nr:hypothetical protein [Labilithrix sp.]
LVGEDGRPRVVDFGLARAAAASVADSDEQGPRGGSRGDLTPFGLTAAGAIMGTPGYMSPEHFRGEAIDPRSDQFSFAVAVYRGVFGAAPFEGEDLHALREAVLAGPASPPARTEVPPAVIDALLRALSPDRDERFPSMHELLVVLEGAIATSPELDPLRSRNKRRLAGAVLVVVAASSAIPMGEGPPVWSTPRGLLVLGLVALGTLLVLGVVFRRMLADSAYNRRIALIHLMPAIGFVVHRALALRLGSSVEAILVADALSITVLLGFAGVVLERWLGIGAILALGYAVLATLYPAWAAPGFGSLLCVMAAVPVLWWTPRARRQEPASWRGSFAGKASSFRRMSGS